MKRISSLLLAFTVSGLCCAALPVAAATEATHEAHWSYHGDTGPAHWGDLKSGSPTCKTGMHQSPIDLYTGAMTHNAQKFQQKYHASPVNVVNNGHSIQANLGTKDNTLDYQGEAYTLQQFHFHAPAEHTVDGISYPMELHLVHTNAAGQITVVGILIKEGSQNKALADLFQQLPVNAQAAAVKETVNPAALLPKDRHAFTYSGSLTTPPCSENVNWIVLTQPITLSPAQISAFRHLYPDNNRPVQALNGRKINR